MCRNKGIETAGFGQRVVVVFANGKYETRSTDYLKQQTACIYH